MRQLAAVIVENKQIAPGYYRMRIESAYLGREMKPGQFVEVKCSSVTETLLRRPLSVHRVNRDGIELLYETVGKGTELLSRKKRGEFLDVIGPLGNGFDTLYAVRSTQYAILVAGGIGVAPLVALAEKLAFSYQLSAIIKKIVVIIGAKTKAHILCEADFKKLGCKVLISTDDGSKGKHGFATGVLKTFLPATNNQEPGTIYACGPTPMLKAVAQIAATHRIDCQVSLEERMACGVGVCLGCPVKVKTLYAVRCTQYEYKMVCKDGPVFNAGEIAW